MTSKNILNLLVLSISLNSFSQLSSFDSKSKEFAAFKSSTTYIVKSGDKKFDAELQKAMEDVWKITPTKIISNAQLETKISDEEASFLSLIEIKGDKVYHYLALFNGGKKKLKLYDHTDMIAYCPINFYQNENNLSECSYRIRNMVESMVMTMDIVEKNNIAGNAYGIAKGLKNYYNEKANQIPDRVLLFTQESLGPKITKEEITEVYPFPFAIVTTAQLEEIIKEKSTEHYYFQPTITVNKSMWVVDPSNGEILMFNFKMMGLVITKEDIAAMVEIIKLKK